MEKCLDFEWSLGYYKREVKIKVQIKIITEKKL